MNKSMKLWTEGPTHNNGIKSRCSVEGDIEADPSAPNHNNLCETRVSPNLPLTENTLVIEGILILEM